MFHALAFVLSLESVLPEGDCDWSALVDAQRQGLRSGTQLRLFRVSEQSRETLAGLAEDGALQATGEQPFPQDRPAQLICDALVPLLEPRRLWLGVYQLSGFASEPSSSVSDARSAGLPFSVDSVQCLDRYSLQEAANETCWFYPTDNGRYLAWENRRSIQTLPGHLPDRSPEPTPIAYRHGDVHVLWSLMADNLALTCVGLTYRRHRIEWPLVGEVPEHLATWTEFEIDAMAESTYRELDSLTVFRQTT